jgi:hypothetical protein
MWFWESADFSHLIASALAATECKHALPWSKRTPLEQQTSALVVNRQLQLLTTKTDYNLMFCSGAICKWCCQL